MSEDGTTAVVTIIGCAGDEFVVSGKGFGEQNVELGRNPSGLLDAPFSTIYNSTAMGWGARYGGMRFNQRSLVLPFNLVGDTSTDWAKCEKLFRRNWSPSRDTIIRVRADGETRELAVRLGQETDQKMEIDPRIRGNSNMVMTCVAGWPFWVDLEETVEWELASGTSGSGVLPPISNPTDVPMYLKFVLDGAQGAGQITWTLPDHSFGSDEWDRPVADADRTVKIRLAQGQGATVDTDPTEETVMADDGSQAPWATLEGDFLYCIPPETFNVELPISVTGAHPGAAVQVRCDRNYQRAWGLAG
ncbi:minor tail protein [Gordonia phage Aleemily]|uniref:Minor tail protein n=1 Tax=Gordonia phage Aleemily TaxID=2965181 RepID=A0A9E7QBT2_9CAUD|nr:minor tail protein [Gordonia phage Aleemily]